MIICGNCPKRDTCKEMCKDLANYLERKEEGRLYSDRHIRRVEVPYAPEHFDEMLPLLAIERVKGRQKKKYIEDFD